MAAGFYENELEHILFPTFNQSLLPLHQFSSSCSLIIGCYFLRQEVIGNISGHNCVFQRLQLTSKRADADGRCSRTNKCKHIGLKLLGSSELMCFKYVCKYVGYQEFLNHQFFVVKWSVLYLVIHSLIFSLVNSIYSVLFSCGYALHCNSVAIQRLVQAANVSTEVFCLHSRHHSHVSLSFASVDLLSVFQLLFATLTKGCG